MSKHKKIPKKIRQKVFDKYTGHCAYCGCPVEYKDMQVDHVESVYVNADISDAMTEQELYDLDNLMPSCRQCNFYKSTFPLEVFRDRLTSVMMKGLQKNFCYRLALKYGLIQERIRPVTFYFEEMDPLTRFHVAHQFQYNAALAEIKKGKKEGHWMWYIFPQIKGLGRSEISVFYAIEDAEEAKAYMRDAVLRVHMLEACQTLLELESEDASQIFGYPDDLKLQSCMTLFAVTVPDCEIFQRVLDKFYGGERDQKTVEILKNQKVV